MRSKYTQQRIKCIQNIVYWIIVVSLLSFSVYVVGKVFFLQRIRISGQSMEPTLHDQEYVFINKLIGHRLKPGDIAVYNGPDGDGRKRIDQNSNTIYAKRVIGTPGDTIQISGGFYCNNSLPGRLICPAENQAALSNLSKEAIDSVKMYRESIKGVPWGVVNFGPILIPAKGCHIDFDEITAYVYASAVEYETGRRPLPGESHTFQKDWYFFGGDYVLNSRDSRYYGLIPSDFIAGKIIPFGHKDRTAAGLRKQDVLLEEALVSTGINRGKLESLLFRYAEDGEKQEIVKKEIIRMFGCK